ncbi:MAG: peptide-methionine (S)-S-oxide reductase MsrA [Candidatus Pacearchaeota archaeon]|jgi:peptide-methionine (S)-S-oxide reductase
MAIEKATFAAGCFWHVEEEFLRVPGVISTVVGYSGGNTKNPTYKQVSSGGTGHTESIQIEFNTTTISYKDLLDVFWRIHDPTSLNKQGLDIGTNYRSVIFYHNLKQKNDAIASKNALQKELGDEKVVTEISKFDKFWPAEEYHQKYFQKNEEGVFCSR